MRISFGTSQLYKKASHRLSIHSHKSHANCLFIHPLLFFPSFITHLPRVYSDLGRQRYVRDGVIRLLIELERGLVFKLLKDNIHHLLDCADGVDEI